ncbi:hypothetical protein [Agrobacterium sp. ST15.16.055]|uniref:hypothetical protein n=1 Tax=Agrobacterium sp. ST15.16.055 TaxID=3020523 RepID=UPI003FA46589
MFEAFDRWRITLSPAFFGGAFPPTTTVEHVTDIMLCFERCTGKSQAIGIFPVLCSKRTIKIRKSKHQFAYNRLAGSALELAAGLDFVVVKATALLANRFTTLPAELPEGFVSLFLSTPKDFPEGEGFFGEKEMSRHLSSFPLPMHRI